VAVAAGDSGLGLIIAAVHVSDLPALSMLLIYQLLIRQYKDRAQEVKELCALCVRRQN
jgi:hypothetical protein